MANSRIYRNEKEVEEVIRRFEDCSFTPEEFGHAQHLTVLVWFLSQYDRETALEKLRAGLLRFLRHLGRNAYHETMTRFWVKIVGNFIEHASKPWDVAGLANEVIERSGDKILFYEYYSRELAGRAEAKAEWHEPDLKPLPKDGFGG